MTPKALRNFFLVWICATLGYTANAQSIYLLTVDSGDMMYDTYGHSALRIHDSTRNSDIVYHYGLYDFDTPNFVIKFMRGKLPYLMGAQRYSDFLYQYRGDRRTVYEQEILLSEGEKKALLQSLRINMMKENRAYMYDFFFDNCATRITDQLITHTDQLTLDGSAPDITFRQMLKEHQQGWPWYDFGVDLIVGAIADEIPTRRQQTFLPIYLMDILSQSTHIVDSIRQPLLSEPYEVMTFDEEDKLRQQSHPWTPMLIFGICTALLLLTRVLGRHNPIIMRWWWRVTFGILTLMAILSLIMIFMWWGTDHLSTKENWNLLWASPLLWSILIFPQRSWIQYVVYVLIGLCIVSLLNCIYQFLPHYFHPATAWLIGIELIILASLLIGQRTFDSVDDDRATSS